MLELSQVRGREQVWANFTASRLSANLLGVYPGGQKQLLPCACEQVLTVVFRLCALWRIGAQSIVWWWKEYFEDLLNLTKMHFEEEAELENCP